MGPKRAVRIEIIGTIVGILALLGVSPAGMRFVFFVRPDTPPLWNGPVFTTLPEVVFLALGSLIAVFNTAVFASSRRGMSPSQFCWPLGWWDLGFVRDDGWNAAQGWKLGPSSD